MITKPTTQQINNKTTQLILILCRIFIPLLVFSAILILDIPRQIGLSFRYGFTSVIIPITILLLFTFHLPEKKWGTISICLTFILFAMPLSGLWMSGAGEKTIVAGLFPWSDANAYYNSARMMLEGELLSGIAARRPLFPGMLASILWMTGRNLQFSLAIMTMLVAISCYFMAREVQRIHGTLASVLLFIILFVFYRRFIGTTMSENLGLPLGVIGFSFFWRGSRDHDVKILLSGLFFVTLALNARAGAFFILPACIIWLIYIFPHDNIKKIFKTTCLASSAVILGFAVNLAICNILNSPHTQPFSNFSYTLYGLAKGGLGWEQILRDYPELRSLDIQEFNRTSYELAFQEIKNNPSGIIIGAVRSFKDFFSLTDIGAFGYIKADSEILSKILRLALFFLSGLGLIFCLCHQKNEHNKLVLMATAGILLSVPFAPPIDAEEMRAYAATILFFAILPIMGLYSILSRIQRLKFLLEPKHIQHSPKYFIQYSIFFVILVLITPILIRFTISSPLFNEIDCLPGETPVYIRFTRGSYINVINDTTLASTRLPDIEWSKYTRSIHNSMHSTMVPEFTNYPAPFTLISAIDLKEWHQLWLFINPDVLPDPPAIIGVCGKWSVDNPESWIIQTMHGRHAEIVTPP